MNNILRDEVNQHTSDEVAKVLADLEAQGVDIAALQTALTAQGMNIETILQNVQNSGGGLTSCIRKIQRGTVSISRYESSVDVTLSGFSNVGKMFVLLHGVSCLHDGSSTAFAVLPYVSSLTAKKLTLGHADSFSDYGKNFSYQVIEFY